MNDSDRKMFSTEDSIQNYQYAAEKSKEIVNLVNILRTPNQTKLVFQNLPRHMRRRTMTHNVKRLPRKFRSAHLSQMSKSGHPQKTKRPSRKYRRKPSNMMKDYMRRQRKYIWLETHIWHAKRFHMTNRWGYRIPLAGCDKNVRACYRASTKHCLLQDLSYIRCIEIQGPLELLDYKFRIIRARYCAPSITAKIYTKGNREGKIDIFQMFSYPHECLGNISFIWHPENGTELRKLWLFIHPVFYEQILTLFIKLFELTKIENTLCEVNQLKNITKNYVIPNTKYENLKENVQLIELKDTMNRFRLTGPLSQAILSKALKPKLIEGKFRESNKIQIDYWNSIKNVTSPAELHPNMVLALNIEDPRLSRPIKRTKAVNDILTDYVSVLDVALPTNESGIWDLDYRQETSSNMISTHELCQMRNKVNLVPGEISSVDKELQSVSILLIQRPGVRSGTNKRNGYGSGWDIIIPAGYGLSTWLSLIMWGARAGALRETKSIARESGFDEFLPDTIGFKSENERKHNEQVTQYFRKPPNKRLNYTKLAIASPFKYPFHQLFNEWNDTVENPEPFFVLRETKLLENIQNILYNKYNIKDICDSYLSHALIPINLTIIGKGNIKDYAMICIPKQRDFRNYFNNLKWRNNDPPLVEPLKSDPNEINRKKLRRDHLRLLKRMRNRRIRLKRKLQEKSNTRVKILKPQNDTLIQEQYRRMCKLWLNDNPNSIRNQASREVFGYITQAGFSYIEGKTAGIGYVTYKGFEKFVKVCKKSKYLVLVRNPCTRNYRWCQIRISIYNS